LVDLFEYMMMHGLTNPKSVNRRQDNTLKNCCIWLVICLNCSYYFHQLESDSVTISVDLASFGTRLSHYSSKHDTFVSHF